MVQTRTFGLPSPAIQRDHVQMKRILVIGTSGSGKSTFAQKLSECLRLPFFASDHFYWEPGWKTASPEKVHQQVLDVICQEAWVLDGNFDDEHEWLWQRADCIIWLDHSLMIILRRIASRNMRWVLTRQPTWSGNQMNMQRAMSGIRHAVKSYSEKRQNYPKWLPELSDTILYRFQTSHEADVWLQSLNQRIE